MPRETIANGTLSALAGSGTQRVMIVNGNAEVIEMLETVLEAGHYDVVFVESTEHAYSQIRRVQPDLVILCVSMEDAEGLRVLSMVKLDERTRRIPILTYATEKTPDDRTADDEEEASDADAGELFVIKPAMQMN